MLVKPSVKLLDFLFDLCTKLQFLIHIFLIRPLKAVAIVVPLLRLECVQAPAVIEISSLTNTNKPTA